MQHEDSLPCTQEPATGPSLSQMHPFHTSSYFSKIQSNNILPSKSRSSEWSLFYTWKNKMCRDVYDLASYGTSHFSLQKFMKPKAIRKFRATSMLSSRCFEDYYRAKSDNHALSCFHHRTSHTHRVDIACGTELWIIKRKVILSRSQ
jgi:hypothetical protein